MSPFNQQKKTTLEKNLAKQIKTLEYEVNTLPAASRRKKDKKNSETFFIVFAITALIGVIIFGLGGWLTVALLGTVLSVIIVESVLLLSAATRFFALPLYNPYLWTRDLFSAKKIKIQNKEYDQCCKNLIELKELAAEKNYLSTKINFKLNNLIKCFPFKLFVQGNADFMQLGLKDQLQRLEQQKKNHPTYSRKQKAEQSWNKIFQYSAITSCVGISLYAFAFIMLLMASTPISLGPLLPFFVTSTSMVAMLIAGPVTLSKLLHGAYFWMRDLFSSAEIKAENKQYAQLEKTINELKKLEQRQSQLNVKINNKLKEFSDTLTPTIDEKGMTENLPNNLECNGENNNKFCKYGVMFPKESTKLQPLYALQTLAPCKYDTQHRYS
ncbi:hypothetical protein [Rickettsiella endosymbiont of Litargus connexus]|jgi:hypothetical protein|uniref:hypothetical protein n=1 Tax=Rickettsiella endosymbiont of Litargus connexus TaxID=3066237 RepID=UPI00376EA60D